MSFDFNNNEVAVNLYDLWARKNLFYETHYEDEVIKKLTDFGRGTNEVSESKGKVLGAGYEALIMAFFIGLYYDKRRPIDTDLDSKSLGQAIQFWGNLDSKKYRHAYPRLREYIFVALVAKTKEIDWYKLDKGEWTPNETVSLLMQTMEEYTNYGLGVIYDKIKEDESYFVGNDSFLNLFLKLTAQETSDDESTEPESLD